MGSLFGGGGDAADAATEAAEIQADAQREALNYLKETERIPEYLRQSAMAQLGGIYGLQMDPTMLSYSAQQPTAQAPAQPIQPSAQQTLGYNPRYRDATHIWARDTSTGVTPGTTPAAVEPAAETRYYEPGSQQALIDQAISSPLYGAIMGGQEAGEEAILRSAGATGGMRSGNAQYGLYDYNTQLQNQALLESYNQQLAGLQSLAGMPSKASEISGQMAGIGQTQAQGITAAAQAQQAASQQGIGNIMGLGQLGLAAYGMFSDRRLKRNIKLIGIVKGWPWYSWTWNVVAEKMGLKGKSYGIMADEVYAKRPDCVIMKDMFMFVLYGKLGVFENGLA